MSGLDPYQFGMADGLFTVTEPVTGIVMEDRNMSHAIGRMHRVLRERRDELAARDPGSLDPDEQRHLEHLRSYPDRFLRAGLWLEHAAA